MFRVHKKFQTFSLGFTLIEIMVTISIIGVLTGIIIEAGNVAKLQARDNQRLTDIKLLQIKLETYKSLYGDYPLYIVTLAGDLNSDGQINADDYVSLNSCFGQRSPTWSANCASNDVNGDGVINADDYVVLNTNFGVSSCGHSLVNPPPPGPSCAAPDPRALINKDQADAFKVYSYIPLQFSSDGTSASCGISYHLGADLENSNNAALQQRSNGIPSTLKPCTLPSNHQVAFKDFTLNQNTYDVISPDTFQH